MNETDLIVVVEDVQLTIPTYEPREPEGYPAFFGARVYQGSSGAVFPLPYIERIERDAQPREWRALTIANGLVSVTILPDLGGRIYRARDLIADYDIFYYNRVIKPALVGLNGPWIAGGVEFNWPQHHRPATYLPCQVAVEREADGAVTVWCGDHDPFHRMREIHGVRLRPGSSLIEVRSRLTNRSDQPRTFLWWANAAVAVHDDYQSFFPTDVTHVADHARRAVTTFPAATERYYGVDYPDQRRAQASDPAEAGRPPADRLDWWRNIPVPTSYMVIDTSDDFFGGYDHAQDVGFVHWADRHIAPGKKQWTWGNSAFGEAWRRNLTDNDGHYIELMAGVFTDNQPDFAFIQPGETKSFSQYWYPIRGIGPVDQANCNAAVRVRVRPTSPADAASGAEVDIHVVVTRSIPHVRITVTSPHGTVSSDPVDLAPDAPFIGTFPLPTEVAPHRLTVRVHAGSEDVLVWHPHDPDAPRAPLNPAVEPPAPCAVGSTDALVRIGTYLAQFRHATRSAEPYFAEAVSRDSADTRALLGLAAIADARADWDVALDYARRAVAALTEWAPSPATGEGHYRLGIAFTRVEDADAADAAFAKAAWNAEWRIAATWQRALIAAQQDRDEDADAYLRAVLALDPGQADAACALAARAAAPSEKDALLDAVLAHDPLHPWARSLRDLPLGNDAGLILDVALASASVGAWSDALALAERAAAAVENDAIGQINVAPLAHYHRARWLDRLGRAEASAAARAAARTAPARHCQASRPADIQVLEWALVTDPHDALAALLLGNVAYALGRADAMIRWEQAAATGTHLSLELRAVVERNLGLAAVNVRGDTTAGLTHYAAAVAYAPTHAKLQSELDQLRAFTRTPVTERLRALEAVRDLVIERDDLAVTYADLLTASGEPEQAIAWLTGHTFQPWEGGEGAALGAWERAQSAVAEQALAASDIARARAAAESALTPLASLGEARHPLASEARLRFLLGDVFAAAGEDDAARAEWARAAHEVGDFVTMSVEPYGVDTIWSIRAYERLGDQAAADALRSELTAWVSTLADRPATIPYFATSLPELRLFAGIDAPTRARDALVATIRTQLAG